MLAALPLKTRSLISFDIGAAGMRACQLRRRGRTLALGEALEIVAGGDDPHDDGMRMTRAARLVAQGAFAGQAVGLVLSPPALQFHALRVPPKILSYPPQQVQDALAWEIARETRTEPGELEVRHWLLPPGNQEGLNVMAVALAAGEARRWVQAFAEHDLQLERIDASPCALTRAARWSWQPTPETAWAVADIGAQRTALTVCVGDAPVYVRTIMVGAARWTRALAQVFGVSAAEAETLKRQTAVTADARAVRATPSGDGEEPLADIVFGALRDSLETLAREIHACFAYTLGNYPAAQPQGLFLRGGGALLGGLSDYLRAKLDMPVIGPHAADDGESATDPCSAHFGVAPTQLAALGGALLAWEDR